MVELEGVVCRGEKRKEEDEEECRSHDDVSVCVCDVGEYGIAGCNGVYIGGRREEIKAKRRRVLMG